MDAEESITMNGAQQKDDEMKWNHKKRTKECFLMFCEVVLQHERELLSETLNSSQESINENRAPEGPSNESIENSTFNSDSDGANGEIAAYTNGGEDGGGDSFNSVTCFCGKPFAGRPMIECSGCLTWLHMSCAKVKRKNIPEFYYCDSCKSNGLLSPTGMNLGTSTASSGEEGSTTPSINRNSHNGTLSSNSIITDGLFTAHQNQNMSGPGTKPRKPKMIKKSSSSSLTMNSSDNIKNNASESKYLTSKKLSPTNVNGKLKKMRQKMSPTTKKMRQSPTKSTKAYASSSLAAAASLTELSLNHQVSMLHTNGISGSLSSENLLKSPIATNNNIYSNIIESQVIAESENGADDKYNKRLKLL